MVERCAYCHDPLGNSRHWYEGNYYHPSCNPQTNVAALQDRIVALEAQLAEARAIANLTIEAAPPATCAHQIWGEDLDGTRTCARCGLTTSPAPKAKG